MLVGAILLPAAFLLAGQVETPPSDVPRVDEASPPTETGGNERALDRALRLFDALEFEAAVAAFDDALTTGPYSREDVEKLYATLGIARAYLDDKEGARWAFDRLLAIAPGFTLPYTTSPKATFVFEEARREAKSRRGVELRLDAPRIARFGEDIDMQVVRAADPFDSIARIEVRHRLKGQDKWTVLEFEAPVMQDKVFAHIDPLTEEQGFVDETGATGAYVEIAVVGFSKEGWEVFRGPDPSRPYELPVGFGAPGPWYTRWWFWTAVAGGAATTALIAGSAAAAAVLYKPETVSFSTQGIPE